MLCTPEKIDMKGLKKIQTPEATRSWSPVPHHVAVTKVLDQLEGKGFELDSEPEIGLSHNGLRCFWLFPLKSEKSDYRVEIGGRNAHDKVLSLALYGGADIYVCSNLQVFSEYALKTKHTAHIFDRLDHLIGVALDELRTDSIVNDMRIEQYKDHEIQNDMIIHDCLIQSMDQNIITAKHLPKVLNEWRNPSHEEFAPRTMWSFNNAYTEVFKTKYNNQEQVQHRSIALTKAMDHWTNFDSTTVCNSVNTELLAA